MTGFRFPGQRIDPSEYVSLSYDGIDPPDGLLECTGMAEGFVIGVPDAYESDGTALHQAFGMDALGSYYYLGLVPVSCTECDPGTSVPMADILADMRSDWVYRGGSHPLDTRDSMEFLVCYCSRNGIAYDDYGSLLDSIPEVSTELAITRGRPVGEWDSETAMLMHGRSSILRYGGYA